MTVGWNVGWWLNKLLLGYMKFIDEVDKTFIANSYCTSCSPCEKLRAWVPISWIFFLTLSMHIFSKTQLLVPNGVTNIVTKQNVSSDFTERFLLTNRFLFADIWLYKWTDVLCLMVGSDEIVGFHFVVLGFLVLCCWWLFLSSSFFIVIDGFTSYRPILSH